MQSWLPALLLMVGGCVFDRGGVSPSAAGDGPAGTDLLAGDLVTLDTAGPDARRLADGATAPDGQGQTCPAWDPAWTKRSTAR